MGQRVEKASIFLHLGGEKDLNCYENHWVCAPKIMASIDTILILWWCPKLKWRCLWVLAKNPKMTKNQNMSNFAQNWWAWPSRVFSNMMWSRGQNLEPWGVFPQFLCQSLPFNLLEFFLSSLQLPSGKLIEIFTMPGHPSLKVQVPICLLQFLL